MILISTKLNVYVRLFKLVMEYEFVLFWQIYAQGANASFDKVYYKRQKVKLAYEEPGTGFMIPGSVILFYCYTVGPIGPRGIYFVECVLLY